jgi:hypothetical protein
VAFGGAGVGGQVIGLFTGPASHPGADANGTTVVAFRTGQDPDAPLPVLRRLTEGAPE